MSVILNEVRRATYLDSIVLMRISRQIAALPEGVRRLREPDGYSVAPSGALRARQAAARAASNTSRGKTASS